MYNKYKKSFYNYLSKKINAKDISVGIFGLGYVGLPRALTFSEKNINVIGFDIKEAIIKNLNKGESHIRHINEKRIKDANETGFFSTTCDFSRVTEVDVIIICVPTPLKNNYKPDLDYILSTLESIKNFLKKGQILILESTTYPGTTDEVLKPLIENLGFNIGSDFFLIYSPEREDPGNQKFKYYEIPKLVAGITNKCSLIGKNIYELLDYEIFILSSTKSAEMTKLLENIYRAINIGLVNELKELADCLEIDLFEVINAASTKPFGFKPFYPGPGVGGHCIPIDPYYLSWKAKEFGIDMKLINSALEINSTMPNFVLKKLIDTLIKHNKKIENSKILILGIAYKKNIDDFRESPSLKIINLLLNKKAKVFFNDPFITGDKKHYICNELNVKSIEITPLNLRSFDCTLLLTDHDSYNYKIIEENSNLIIDTRGRFNKSMNIVRA